MVCKVTGIFSEAPRESTPDPAARDTRARATLTRETRRTHDDDDGDGE